MTKKLKLVENFHKVFGIPVLDKPTIPAIERCKLRVKLLKEEIQELEDAIEANNLVEMLGALTDIDYILHGTYLEFGLQHVKEEAFMEVHLSNMTKLGDDGKPVRRPDGKVIKGPNFILPNLEQFIK